MLIGQTVQMDPPAVLDEYGEALPARAGVWGTTTPGTITVSPTGLVTAVAVGPAVVTYTAEGVVGTAAGAVVTPGLAVGYPATPGPAVGFPVPPGLGIGYPTASDPDVLVLTP